MFYFCIFQSMENALNGPKRIRSCFPSNPDPTIILSKTDFDFENLLLGDVCDPRFLGLPSFRFLVVPIPRFLDFPIPRFPSGIPGGTGP